VDGRPNQPVPISKGTRITQLIYARSSSGAKQTYALQIHRLIGSETDLGVRVADATFDPPFESGQDKAFQVRLRSAPLADGADVRLVLWDRGQQVRVTAGRPVPSPTPPRSLAVEDADEFVLAGPLRKTNSTAKGRRLSLQGPSQLAEQPLLFLLDPGMTRQIQVMVDCADVSKQTSSTYTLTVVRDPCPLEAPYYDPDKRICANTCQRGLWPNDALQRCSLCNTNCAVCASLDSCRMCTPDTFLWTYTLQPDGSCSKTPNTVWQQYDMWLMAAAGSFGLFLLLGCCGIAALCATRRKTYDDDEDDDDDYAGE